MRATWPAGTTAGASRWMPRSGSKATTAPGWNGCCATVPARPPFALERLEQLAEDALVYRFPKPQPDGRTELRLTPLELLERLAALIPPPRLHRHRYHGVLAPNAALRAQVSALARQPPAPLPDAAHALHARARSPARTLWAVLLARIYEILPLPCAQCGSEMRIIAFVTDKAAVKTILGHLGEPSAPPEAAPARGPPLWDLAHEPPADWGEAPAPLPEFVFDQRLSW